MEKLKQNYIDDILDTSKNQRRKYKMVNNDDGTVSLIDVTDYEQVGSEFLASDMNAITKAVNGKMDSDGDASGTTVTFTEPTELSQPTTGEKLSGIIGKVSLAIKNIKTLITLIGNTDIKSIGDGTVTCAISEINSKLTKNNIVKNNRVAITQTSASNPFVCPSDGYVTADSAVGVTNQTVVATISDVAIVTARSNGNFYGSDAVYVRKGMQLYIIVKTGSVFFYPFT